MTSFEVDDIGNKIPYCLMDICDRFIFISLTKYLSPLFYSLKMTPNDITTLSLFFGIPTIICLCQNKFIYASICYFIFYTLDCVDGYMARKYNQVTSFGDYYDHIRDICINIPVLSIVLFYILKTEQYVPLVITIFCGITSTIYYGCLEKYNDKDDNQTFFSCFKKLCMDINHLRYLRFCGTGTFIMLIISILIKTDRILNISMI